MAYRLTPDELLQPKSVTLPSLDRAKLKYLGKGKLSKGIRFCLRFYEKTNPINLDEIGK